MTEIAAAPTSVKVTENNKNEKSAPD